MNSLHQLQIWLSRRRALILVIVLGVLLWGLPAWLKETPPLITRTLGSSTQHVDVLWFNQDMFYMMTANAGGVAYVVPLAGDNLMAIDVRDGTTMWDVQLPPERSGARGLLANQNTVFVVTTLSIDAYEAETGNLKWSTKLGSGHVSIISQLDSEVLRVYYGDQLYEVDSKTGEVLSIAPKDTVVWMSGDIVLRILSANFLIAFDRQSGEQLWDNAPSFYLRELQEPQAIGREILIVANAPAQA